MWARYFTNIYVLAIPEREPYVTSVMSKLGISNVVYVQSGNSPLPPTHPTTLPAGLAITGGDYRTWSGHVAAMKHFLRSKGTRMLVFEDDIEFISTFVPDVLDLMKYVPRRAVVYLGRCWSQCWLDTPVVPGLVRTYKSSCMHAASLSREAAQYYVAQYPYAPADDILQDIIAKYDLPAYAYQPGLFYQNQTRFRSTAGVLRKDPATKDCKADYSGYIYAAIVSVLLTATVCIVGYIERIVR